MASGYAREERSYAALAACGNEERRSRGLHHTRAAAAERCFAYERRALAIAHRIACTCWVQRRAKICSWLNVPHLGQRA